MCRINPWMGFVSISSGNCSSLNHIICMIFHHGIQAQHQLIGPGGQLPQAESITFLQQSMKPK